MRTYGNFSVSLPPDMRDAAEKRAAALGYKRSTYIQQLILADLKRQGLSTTNDSQEEPEVKKPAKKAAKKKGPQ